MQNLRLNYCRSPLIILSLLCLILALAGMGGAQSGRKTRTKNQLPPPVETPTPEPTPTPKNREPVKAELTLKVVDNISQSVYLDLTFPERMPRWVFERLKTSSLLAVEFGESATFKQAEKLAKSSADAFIVLVELEENPFGTSAGGTRATNGNVWINFYVLTPVSGKIKQKGRAFLKPESLRGNTGVLNRRRSCATNFTNEDFLLWEASLETAERIISGFNLPVPPLKCNTQF